MRYLGVVVLSALVMVLSACDTITDAPLDGISVQAVTFDAETGQGFVGKGDVQLAFGWNNKQLQDNAGSVEFRVSSVAETTWECYNSRNEKTQERSRTTTTEGVIDSIARDRNQITGFSLSGYVAGASTTTADGPSLNSCPSTAGSWAYVEGSTETTAPEATGLQISIDGMNWDDL